MRAITAAFVCLLALVLAPLAARAQSYELQRAYAAMNAARATGTGGDPGESQVLCQIVDRIIGGTDDFDTHLLQDSPG